MQETSDSRVPDPPPFVVVAGYGLPGRLLVDLLLSRKIEFAVVELNPQTCQRASASGMRIIAGDASDPETLRRAGVEKATLVALMVPSDEVVLAAVPVVRRMNPGAHIIARCAFTSTGLEAQKRGADRSIVAEQVVARELDQLAREILHI